MVIVQTVSVIDSEEKIEIKEWNISHLSECCWRLIRLVILNL